MEKHDCILVRKSHVQYGRPCYLATDASTQRISFLGDYSWDAWLHVSQAKKVKCGLPHIESLGSGVDGNGHAIDYVNDYPAEHEPLVVDLTNQATNTFYIEMEPSIADAELPCFILLRENARPMCSAIVVQLFCHNLLDFPDMVARISEIRSVSEKLNLLRPRRKSRSSPGVASPPMDIYEQKMKKAETIAVHEGMFIPIEIGDGTSNTLGVLNLVKKFEDNTFAAVLNLQDTPAHFQIQSGLIIHRTACWEMDGKINRIEKDIAVIV